MIESGYYPPPDEWKPIIGFATTNICKCCKGQIKSSNGYIFLYNGDDIQKRLLEINNRKHKGKTERKLYELQ